VRNERLNRLPIDRSATRERVLLALLLAAAVGWAWANRFFQDDAYISLTYARNWVAGQGLVFNPGERVEGYTNFLWTALLAIPLRLGWDPVRFALLAGMACFAGTLVVACRLARTLMPDLRGAGLCAVFLLATNYSFSAYATGGLETQLQTLLLAAAALLAFACEGRGRWRLREFAGVSALAGLALLTRLDSAVLLAVPAVLALRAAWRGPRRAAALAALTIPGIILLGPWVLWKWHYYGAILPNTFHAKCGVGAWTRGIGYVTLFFLCYLLFIPLALAVHDLWVRRHDGGSRLVRWALVAAAAWLVYVAAVGGDFMEFRFLVPSLPLLAAMAAGALVATPARRLVLLPLLAASLVHAAWFDRSPLKRGLASVPELRRYVEGPGNWREIGECLRGAFRDDTDVRLAVTAAGALPYHARLACVDMLGLNDAWVARHGAPLSARAGHRRIATVEYLRRRGVNLVIGHPTLVSRADAPESYRTSDPLLQSLFVYRAMPDPESLPAGARMLEIPFDPTHVLLAIYLTPHPAVEAKIQSCGWRTRPLRNG
jgi:arabinofuranosyltransferase